jgi:hypothetical protein
MMVQAARAWATPNTVVTRFFQEELPRDFVEWLVRANDFSLTQQLRASEPILSLLETGEVDIPFYDLRRVLVYWNLPQGEPRINPLADEEAKRRKRAERRGERGRGRGRGRGYGSMRTSEGQEGQP